LTAENGVAQLALFWYWPEFDKSRYLLAVLMACQWGVLGTFGKKRLLDNDAAAHILAATRVTTAYAAAYATDAYAAFAIHTYNAYAADYVAAAITIKSEFHYIVEELKNDLYLISACQKTPFLQCEALVFGIEDFAKEDRNGAAQPIDGARFGFKPKSSSRTGVFFRLKNDLHAAFFVQPDCKIVSPGVCRAAVF
jgi:hypothetical protein